MDQLPVFALAASALTGGMGAGVFQLYAFVIMPALGRTDDRTFVVAFQHIDRAIVGPYLLAFFFAPMVFTAVAFALSFDDAGRLALTGVALALHVLMLVLTLTVNVPLNDAIKAAGDPGVDAGRAAGIREAFRAPRWVRSNNVRVAASLVGTGCVLWALVREAMG